MNEGQFPYDPTWPSAWMFALRGDVSLADNKAVNTHHDRGSHVTIDRGGVLTYRCECGSTFSRAPGWRNDEALAWVATHRVHMPPEAAS